MNYQTEISMFNEWLETHALTASGIALWYAFMFMAYRSGWPTEMAIPVSALCLRSKLSRSAVYKERNMLRDYGLLDFDTTSGRKSTCYRIRSFEARLVAPEMSAIRTQTETRSTIPAEDASEMSTIISTSQTQTSDERIKTGETFTTWTQPCTQTEDSTYISIKNKYRDKRGYGGKKRSSAKHRDAFDLTFITDTHWLELVQTWLDYKRSRGESYKSELSVKKCFALLRDLSADDPSVALAIIDRSIANNWAGLFPLRDAQPSHAARAGREQHPGQILQPANEERTRSLLEKFGRK